MLTELSRPSWVPIRAVISTAQEERKVPTCDPDSSGEGGNSVGFATIEASDFQVRLDLK